MVKEQITLQEMVDFFNELLKIDNKAISDLFAFGVPCNEALANHPTVQCLKTDDGFRVRILGIINGLFGSDDKGWGHFAMEYNTDNGEIEKFFIPTDEQIAKWSIKK